MSVIYKYPIKFSTRFNLQMQDGAKILSVAVQRGQPVIWAKVDEERRIVTRWFKVLMTGETFEESEVSQYLGTFELPNGIVGHLFSELNNWSTSPAPRPYGALEEKHV